MVNFYSYAEYYLAVILCQFSRTYELFANQLSRKQPSFNSIESNKASSDCIFIFGDGVMSWEFILHYPLVN